MRNGKTDLSLPCHGEHRVSGLFSCIFPFFRGVSDPLIPTREIQVNYIRSMREYPSNPFEG